MRDLHESTGVESAEATELISQQDGNSPAPGNTQPPAPQISIMAILALVVGAFGILLVPGIVGLVLAVVALWQIDRSEGRLIGRELALSALVLCTVLLIYHLILWGMVSAAAAAAGFFMDSINGFFEAIAGWFE